MFGGIAESDAFGTNWNLDEIQQLDDITAGGFLDEEAGLHHEDHETPRERLTLEKQALMPVVNSMIYNSWRQEQSYIQFFNKCPEILKIVGRIVGCESTAETTQFLVDDGTARIPCIYLHPADMTPYRRKQLAQIEATDRSVVIYGSYNAMYSVKAPAILIYKIREAISYDEVTLHNLDVIHLIVSQETEGAAFNPNDMNAILQNYDAKQPEPPRAPVEQGQNVLSTSTGAGGPLTLMKFVALLLADETRSGNLNGLNVMEITQRCKQERNFQSISEQHVRKVLAELERDATVYQTLDNNTFASTDA